MKSKHEENLLWLIRERGIQEPIREYKFHPTRRWRFDFAWPDFRVAVEVDGAIFKKGGGRHNRGASMLRDMEKYNEAALLGWKVVRVGEKHLRLGQAIQWIERALNEIND